ncbi:Mu transposase C-terminal domain-containing protein [Trichormus variabilis ARAD]|uniref:Mu transposase C-terminal domain-containing protein n=1 Tax=Trichormus variabilis N2B TaxID=2681315 RepID=A0ABR6SF27_ANAVA|nr:Mu transposase C-terminal domain-containing protein [Trichormus variabilis ARAD]MBC1256425.1 Mu transposase C-terminal domain-containing protein [Trichormus variabilis V5]MBC1268761.1 Mu transposase C-terminal domain-containing protein [Trichormus variabilis FSR]MBC1305026.1 Mu transposase C-terminal domain-containing protein [Trichormus variabilis N2B]MBC1313877.1 Mu transposase C-terminal domain-containing protein [Trichormus variabilis PNB]MBC1329072.1 Mu transposase C-terminal domain-co
MPSEKLITDDVKLRMEVIQSLTEPCDRKTYSEKKKEAAEKLGVTIRQVERLLKKWREEGLVGLATTRADKGKYRLEQEWVDFIINTYTNGNKKGKQMTRHQVFLKVKGEAKEKGLKKGEYPSHQSIYRILDKHIEGKERKDNARSPGYSGEKLTHMTRDGRELEVEGSNDVWQCDHTRLDVMLVDEYGVLDRPWLTIVIDSYSRCVMGFYLGFDHPSSQIDALALHHAILPKSYSSEYTLRHEWVAYGKPNYFYTDGGKDFTSIHTTEQVAVQIGFSCALRRRPSDGGIVERFFKTLNEQVLNTLPGYTGSNVQQRPENVDKNACLTLKNLEMVLVRYIVDEYNQHTDARMKDQSRIGRWEAGSMVEPYLYNELDLAICLMKQERRKVQKYGCIQFENLTYRADHLRGRDGETVALRYDPADVTTLLVYEINADGTEEFLDYAHAQSLETEHLSLRELKAINKRLKEASEEINNDSILEAMLDRQAFVEQTVKQNRKQRRQAASEQVNPVEPVAKKFAVPEPKEVETDSEPDMELPNYEVRYMDEFFEED